MTSIIVKSGEKASPKNIIRFPMHRVPWRGGVTPIVLRDAARRLMHAKGVEAVVEVFDRFGIERPTMFDVPVALRQPMHAALRNAAAGWSYLG